MEILYFESKITFRRENETRAVYLSVLIKSGYESGTILLLDDDGRLDDLWVEFVPKFRKFKYMKEGFLMIKETSKKSKIENYEFLIAEHEIDRDG